MVVGSAHAYEANTACKTCGYPPSHQRHQGSETVEPTCTFRKNPYCKSCGYVESHAVHMGEPCMEHTTPLEDVLFIHNFHSFKANVHKSLDDSIVCGKCNMVRSYPIHDVAEATKMASRHHDFKGIQVEWSTYRMCTLCGQDFRHSVHSNGSALSKDSPSTTIPDPPPTYGAHMYVTLDPEDRTLPCLACTYSEDAFHHVTADSIAAIAVEEYIQEEKRRQDNEPKRTRTIAEEASDIVYGDREQAYDDPNINFEKLALMWTAVLLRKLRPGVQITSRDTALMQVCLKISRESFRPQHDNRVDMIGYTLCLQRIVQQQEAKDIEDDDHYSKYEDNDE